MPTPLNKQLYEQVKEYADKIYSHPSAFKSGFIVQEYKRRHGKYKNDNKTKNLKRWYAEKWHDIGNKDYPVFRPSVKINKHTPLLVNEIDENDLRKKIEQKQLIRGFKNLTPFKHK